MSTRLKDYRAAQTAIERAQERRRKEALARLVEEQTRRDRRKNLLLAPVRVVRDLLKMVKEA